MAETTIVPEPRVHPAIVFVPFLIGAAVSVFLGVYSKVHDPTNEPTIQLFFSSTLAMKAWFTTFAVILALVQLYTALRMYGKLSLPPRELPVWFGAVHRLSGIAAFLFTLPVAYHCLWALGFDPLGNTRVFFHSVFGLFFYGAFAAKVVIVRSRQMPGWALPVVGGSVFTVLVLIWLTSSLWYYQNIGFPEF